MDNLITETPTMKIKGFHPSQLKVIPATAKDRDIHNVLQKIVATDAIAKLPAADKEIIDTILNSYQRKIYGLAPTNKDYVLSGHEFLEWDRLESRHYVRYLIYRYRYSMFPELYTVDRYPPCIQIEPSSICNFRCIMCYQSDASFSSKPAGFMGNMKLDLFRKIIDEIQGNVEAVTLASRGEPTLNKSFIEMMEYCKGKFLALKVNSNASMLNEALIHSLFSNEVSTIVFSIDSADKQLYEKIRVGGKFEKLIKNLENFIDIKNKYYSNTKTVVRISGVKLNELQDIDRMNDMWKRYADIIAFTNYTPWQSTYDNPVNEIEKPCSELWRRLFIWQDGKVNPCDYDYKSNLSRWNIQNQSISEIWQSTEYNELRKAHLDKERSKFEPCRKCISV